MTSKRSFFSAVNQTTKNYKKRRCYEEDDNFFESARLEWTSTCGVCTDGPPFVLGSQSGFQKQIKKLAPGANDTHCFVHKYAHAGKTLSVQLNDILNSVEEIVNFIKAGGLSPCQFKELCRDMNSTHETLLFHSAIRWLSKGNVLNRVYEMKNEIQVFSKFQKKGNFRRT